MTVSDLMTRSIVTVGADDNLAHARDVMDTGHFRHLPVVNDDGELEGILSQRDMLRIMAGIERIPYSEQRRTLGATKVAEAMTVEPDTVLADTPLKDAGQVLLENKYGCLPVVEGTTLVGILTEADFVRFALEQID